MNDEKDELISHFSNIRFSSKYVINTTSDKRNFVDKNKTKFLTKGSILREVRVKNKEIVFYNIPKILKESHFETKDLHQVFVLYKAL